MLDLVVFGFVALLLFRGWTRGFVREAMDLVGLIVGAFLAFRLGPAVGAVIEAMSGISSDAGRLVGGAVVFLGVGIGAAYGVKMLQRRMSLPGLNLANRAGGAGLAATWGLFLVTLMLTVAAILPLPPAVATHLDDSAFGRTLTDPGGLPQEMFNGLAGDSVVQSLLNLRRLLGERRVVVDHDDVIALPEVDVSDLEVDEGDARQVFDLVNRARIDAGVDPLAWGDGLAGVGLGHAAEMYRDLYFSHVSPVTGDVGDRLQSAGIPFRLAGENLALAATAEDVHRGLMESTGHRENIESDSFTRVGIAVIDGPLGLMTVQIFTG